MEPPTPVLPQGHQKQLFEELFKKTRPTPATASIPSNQSPKSQRSSQNQDTISDGKASNKSNAILGAPSLPKDPERASLSSQISRVSHSLIYKVKSHKMNGL